MLKKKQNMTATVRLTIECVKGCAFAVREKCIPLTDIGRPAKCPTCSPNQWREDNPLWNEDAVEKAAKKSHEQYGAAYKELANR